MRSTATVRALAAAALVALAPAAGAQSAPLPPADQVIEKYIAAMGGRAAVSKHSAYRAKGTFEMPAAGIKGDFEAVHARPNRMAMKMNIPGMGEIYQGYNGTVGWSVNPMQGPRLIEGKELEHLAADADFDNWFRGSANVASRETLEKTEMAGQPCYKVRIVFKSGMENHDCYHTETGLLVATTMKRESPMGTMEITSFMEDYKDFGGVKYPTRVRQQMMGQEQVMTFTSLDFGAVEPSAFEPPPAIQTLLKQKQ